MRKNRSTVVTAGGKSYEEIAELLGLSRQRVQQLGERALLKIKKGLIKSGWTP